MKVHNLKKYMEKLTSSCSSVTSVLTDHSDTHNRQGGGGGRGEESRELGVGRGRGGGENQMLGVIHMQADIETALGEVLCKKNF